MGYQFKLEALRRYRQFQEETQQKELSIANMIRDQIQSELERKLSTLKKTEMDLAAHQNKDAASPLLTLYENFLKRTHAEIQLQRKKVIAAEKTCAQKRGALMEAVKKRKVLDRIKEKDLERYLADLEHKESKFINEMAINRFALQQK